MTPSTAPGVGDPDTAATPLAGALWLDDRAPYPGLLQVLDEHGRAFEVTAERTACEHLRITPCWGPTGELTGTWRLTHAPTGLRVPGTDGLSPEQLRLVARDLADLDCWASSRIEALRTQAGFLAARIDQARERATR